jgi:hypothetical protein
MKSSGGSAGAKEKKPDSSSLGKAKSIRLLRLRFSALPA